MNCLVCAIVHSVDSLSLCIINNALSVYLGLRFSTGVLGSYSPACQSLLFSNSPYQLHFQKCLEHILQEGDRPFIFCFGGLFVAADVIEKN